MATVGITYSEGAATNNHSFRTHGRFSVHSSEGAVMAAASGLGTITNAYTTDGVNVGGYAAEFVRIYDSYVGKAQAQVDAEKQLNESMVHELSIRGLKKGPDTQLYVYPVDYVEVNADQKYGNTLNALGFVGFDFGKTP